MQKIESKGLRVFGIIMSMIGIALVLRPLIEMLFGKPLTFSFFGLFSGAPALALAIFTLIGGFGIIFVTEPLEEEKK